MLKNVRRKEVKMENKKTYRKPSLLEGITKAVREEAKRRKSEPGALLCDIVVLAVSLFFARRHIVAGSYPLAPALVAILPTRVWVSLLGAVAGALTLGKSGIIHAIILVIVVFLRIIISGGSGQKGGELFGEPTVMRIAAVTVASFVGAAYEILLGGFSLSSALFGVFGVLLSVAFAFIYSGFFSIPLTVSDLLYGTKNIFVRKELTKDRFELWFFQASALAFAFLIPFSLDGYDFFGITPSYMAATFLTLFVAKRFGAPRAMAVGFATALGISSVQAVSFALAGAVAGLLFNFGIGYAVLGGGLLLVAWSAYAGGLNGFLEVFPEYTVAALLALPSFKRTPTERTPERSDGVLREASEMVGAVAVAYQSRLSYMEELEDMVASLPVAFRRYAEEGEAKIDEVRDRIISLMREAGLEPCEENAEKIATKVYKKQKPTAEDYASLGKGAEALLPLLEAACLEAGTVRGRSPEGYAREYELMAKLISEAARATARERMLDGEASERLLTVFSSFGFPDGVLKAYGTRKKHIIAAGADKDGEVISSSELKAALEGAIGGALGDFEFFRKGEVALMKCTRCPAFSVEYAAASHAAQGGVSGDRSVFFDRDGAFYSLISDGMGTGREAGRTSGLVTDFLSRAIHPAFDENPTLSVLNHCILELGEECSATVDMLKLDLLLGEAEFIKSGAAPSYVKREGSLFRVRSRTAPIGLMRGVDAERIRVEVKSGDIIIMLSDGVGGSVEDAPWLPMLLNEPAPESLQEYADRILAAARKNGNGSDDMTVAVVRFSRVGR